MSQSSAARRAAFREAVQQRRALLMPGAFNAMSARVVADAGFSALYITGAGVTNMSFGLPDLGFIGLSDIAEHTSRIRDAVDLPLVVDADTGFGNALNVRQTVRTLERAGADAIQLEDQVSPKKCGHFAGKAVISTSEMVGKLHAAVDAREDANFQIVARTDACAVHGFEAAIERAHRFAEAGADILFVEAVETFDEIKRLPTLLSTPQLINSACKKHLPCCATKASSTKTRPCWLRSTSASAWSTSRSSIDSTNNTPQTTTDRARLSRVV
jgi:2-methylisocitrate lyase-like PEP mutase family enzyme